MTRASVARSRSMSLRRGLGFGMRLGALGQGSLTTRTARPGGYPCGPASRPAGGTPRRTVRPGRCEACGRPGPGRWRLGLGIKLGQGRPDRVGVDALLAQLVGERPAGQAPAVVPAGHPGPGERLVVDDADLAVALEDLCGDVGRDPPLVSAPASSARVRGRTASSRRQISRARSPGSTTAASAALAAAPTVPRLAHRHAAPPEPRPPVPQPPPDSVSAEPGPCSSRPASSGKASLRDASPRDASSGADRTRGGAASQPRPVRPRRLPATIATRVRALHGPVRSPPAAGSAHRWRRSPAHAELLEDLLLDLGRDVGVVLEEGAGVFLALPELIAVVGVPGARLADDSLLDSDVDQRPSREIPLPYMMSNSACLKGAAQLCTTVSLATNVCNSSTSMSKVRARFAGRISRTVAYRSWSASTSCRNGSSSASARGAPGHAAAGTDPGPASSHREDPPRRRR